MWSIVIAQRPDFLLADLNLGPPVLSLTVLGNQLFKLGHVLDQTVLFQLDVRVHRRQRFPVEQVGRLKQNHVPPVFIHATERAGAVVRPVLVPHQTHIAQRARNEIGMTDPQIQRRCLQRVHRMKICCRIFRAED